MTRDDDRTVTDDLLSQSSETIQLAEPERALGSAETARLAGNPSSTLMPGEPGAEDMQAVFDAVQQLARPGAAEAFEIGKTLGEGGMGFVRSARQKSAGRTVAIKTLQNDGAGTAKELRLLREAWLTASLEHPNIVPVYDVVLDAERGPLIVLKKVEGVTWSDVIRQPELARDRFAAADLLEFNVETLMQVCRALEFAHSKNILHRDIKPANVMIGSFGEVYLLDWGIAVATVADPEGRIPTLGSDGRIVGTPSFMAPDMLIAGGRSVTTRTDVYLLGATLYTAVMGRPPHAYDDPKQLVESIWKSTPPIDEDVPEPLAAIIRKAMNADASLRYESPEAMRQALALFLKNRETLRLLDEARSRLDDLEALIATGDASREQLYQRFGACRFALQESLRRWPENEDAKETLARLVDTMVSQLLVLGDPSAAAVILAEHGGVRPALEARVEEALREERARREELERLEADLDPTIGRRVRRIAMVAMGVVWTFAPLTANVVDPRQMPRVFNLASPVVLLVLGLGVWWRTREALNKTAINRRFIVAMLVGFCAHMINVLVVNLAGLPLRSELPVGMVTFGTIVAVLAYTAERRFWPLVPVYWIGALVGAVYRLESAYVLSVCNLLLTLYMFAIWKPANTERAHDDAS